MIDGAGEDIITEDIKFLELTYTEAVIAAMKKTDRRTLMDIMQGLTRRERKGSRSSKPSGRITRIVS